MGFISRFTNSISHKLIDSTVTEKLAQAEARFEQGMGQWRRCLRNDFIVVSLVSLIAFVSGRLGMVRTQFKLSLCVIFIYSLMVFCVRRAKNIIVLYRN